jgi:hypothetical protein
MPRLRYKKNFNISARDFTAPDEETENGIRASGEHFLSNRNMLAQLDESELDLAINYHQTQINLLKEELDGRKDGTRQKAPKYEEWKATDFCPEMFDQRFSKKPRRENNRTSGWASCDKTRTDKNARERNKIAKLAQQIKALGLTADDLKKLWSDRTYGA